MSAQPLPLSPASSDPLRFARQVVAAEADALAGLARRLDGSLLAAIELVRESRGCVIVCGIGKAGLIGQKIAATLASTGTRSHFVHPAEASHGDLGRIGRDDVALVLSYSGETIEVTRLLPSLREMGVPVIAITGKRRSTLARCAAVTLDVGPLEEACPIGLAPSTSTTAMLALGDALALTLSHLREFTRDDFARFHPGGSLGRKLARVEDEMRPLNQCRVARDTDTVRAVLVALRQPGRRTGAVMLVDANGQLTGLFTDSDLARLFENRRDAAVDEPIARVMTRGPKTVTVGGALADAVQFMAAHKISELPVVDETGSPAGLLDVTDIVALLPEDALAETGDADTSIGVTNDVPSSEIPTVKFPERAISGAFGGKKNSGPPLGT